MALTVGTIRDLIELYAGQGGVSRNRIPPTLLYRLINLKMQEFGSRTGAVTTIGTDTTVANVQEYELAENVVHITKVTVDDEIAYKITYEQVDEMANKYS